MVRPMIQWALLFTLLFSFAMWVWPTPYFYLHVGNNPVRVNRITGEIDFCTLQGWTPQLPLFR